MKTSDVPQDDENLLGGATRDVCYALDENGKYTQVLSTGWAPKNVVIKQAWDVINEQIEEARQLVLSGKASPLVYHMEKCMMDASLVSEYTGFSKKTVKKHGEPIEFNKLSTKELEKYAETFNISIDELKTVQ
jgi:hypothetical protein